MVAGEGVEPPLPDSESGVLPIGRSAIMTDQLGPVGFGADGES